MPDALPLTASWAVAIVTTATAVVSALSAVLIWLYRRISGYRDYLNGRIREVHDDMHAQVSEVRSSVDSLQREVEQQGQMIHETRAQSVTHRDLREAERRFAETVREIVDPIRQDLRELRAAMGNGKGDGR